MKNDKFAIFYSIRFWQLFLAGVGAGLATYSQSQNVLLSISVAISSWLGSSVIVGTADRISEQQTVAAAVTSGQVSAEKATGIPPVDKTN